MRSIVFEPLVPNLKFFVRAGRDLGPEGIKSLVPPPGELLVAGDVAGDLGRGAV